MSDRPSDNLAGLDIDQVRRIDEVCRRFEADWREGHQPRVEDYLDGVSEEGRVALRTELEVLVRELCAPEQAEPRVRATARTPPSTVAEAPTIPPRDPLVAPAPVEASSSVHDSLTRPPRHDSTIDLTPYSSAESAVPSPTPVRYFGDYEIIRELARGGMGVVFEARQLSLNRKVALKMILAGQLANETDVKRFYTEAEAAANLDHPAIVPIFEIGHHEGQHYFSMGFVEGQSLAHRLSDGPLPVREAADLIRRVSEGIEYAHGRGVIHRDLKPANILLDMSGNPRVTDFGLAKKVQSDSGLTGSGQIMGTPSYMPPEQAGGNRGDVGPAADVYALGATFYALVTGRPPFQAATAMETVIQVISEEPVPPRRLNALIPRDLDTICLKCLEKEPERRYTSARSLADELNRFLAGEPIVARPVGLAERAVKWIRRKPVVAALIALVVATGLLGLSGIILEWRAAVAARHDAQHQALIAKNSAAAARDEAEFAKRRLYDAKMNVVQRAWEDWGPDLFLKTLDDQRPDKQDGVDRLGFEWHYWRRKLSLGHHTIGGRGGAVLGVSFDPSGSRLAYVGFDGIVRICDPVTGKDALTLKGPTAKASCLAFSPDGSRIASGGFDGEVRLWDAVSGQEKRTLKGHTGSVASVAFNRDGSRLASASSDKTVKVWNAATGARALTLEGHAGEVTSVAFSPSGLWIATASGIPRKLGEVKVWDAATGRVVRTFKGHTALVTSVAFSPDGASLASSSADGTITVWKTASDQVSLAFRGRVLSVWCVAFSPDGSRIASAGVDGSVSVWDSVTGQEQLTLRGHGGPVTGASFNRDGSRLASSSLDGTVNVWDAVKGQETLTLSGNTGNATHRTGEAKGLALSPDGSRIACAGSDKTVKVWDVERETMTLQLVGHRRDVTSVAFSPDGSRIASAGDDGTVRVWNSETGQVTRVFERKSGAVLCVAFNPDGTSLACAGSDGTVTVYDLAAAEVMLTLKGTSPACCCVAFSADGSRIAIGGIGEVSVFDATTGQATVSITWRNSMVTSVGFSADGLHLASSGIDGSIKVWDAVTGQEALNLEGHTGGVNGVAFSPDGLRIASASFDQTVKVWDHATGQETLTLKGHNNVVTGVAFTRDGRRLVSAGADGTVKIWDARPVDDASAKPGSSPPATIAAPAKATPLFKSSRSSR
jgi:WD40 repeat protein